MFQCFSPPLLSTHGTVYPAKKNIVDEIFQFSDKMHGHFLFLFNLFILAGDKASAAAGASVLQSTDHACTLYKSKKVLLNKYSHILSL